MSQENVSAALDGVEARVAQLETLVFGAVATPLSTLPHPATPFSGQLANTHKALQSFAGKHAAVKDIWRLSKFHPSRRLIRPALFSHLLLLLGSGKDLQQLISVHQLDELTLSVGAKEEIIFAGESQLLADAKNLEQVRILEPQIAPTAASELPDYSRRLAPLESSTSSQALTQSELGDRMVALLAAYNDTITALSRQFIAWDQIITQAEKATMRD
eukprot:m.187755 g.187755  ORF g.187755 m.187755 type:complete len:216 (+) comp53581_c0_seq7:53-700(+)